MAESADLFWRTLPRAAAPYAQRADVRDTRLDRALLAAGARLARPLRRGRRRAERVAGLVEREQSAADALSDARLLAAAQALRPLLLRKGFRDELVAKSFALVRSAATRTLGMRHFPAQLIGGHIILGGMLAEMDTGEGKTLTATLPASTVALAGLPVHVVTVNDYLAQRDGEWMRPVYESLGLSVGIASRDQDPGMRRAAYAADICYCTNKDLGFDYLRDGLTLAARGGRGRLLLETFLERGDRIDRLLLRGLHFAIVDEADSVLIDEARTPLIISGEQGADGDAQLYEEALRIVRLLETGTDFQLHATERIARLTDRGRARLGELAQALPSAWRSARGREELAEQGLAALHLFQRDTHYLVRDGKVQIIDEYTGRVMADRSWERGLQQLIEVKEDCAVSGRRSTLARITYQRLFRRYLRLAGMTGTATEVAPELDAVYGLTAVRVPTNRPMARRNLGIRLYATREQKWAAVARSITLSREQGRPVLVGTRSVAASEELAAVLDGMGIEHVVLNARQDGQEAQIIAQAGAPGAVTVATNMAGRGTDIRLAAETAARGGLHVILTEFHESRRIDRQLFGRCGRQGDRGSYEAVVSLDDEILRKRAGGLSRLLAARYAGRSVPLPAWAAWLLRASAQRAAERANSRDRIATMEIDQRLESALAFAGKGE